MNYEKMTKKEILNLVECNNICLLSVSENDNPYIIPVYYESDYRDNTLIITIKSKNIGKKIRYIKSNDKACLYFDCKNNSSIKTVIAFGTLYIDEDEECDDKINISIVIDKISGRKHSIVCPRSKNRLYHYK